MARVPGAAASATGSSAPCAWRGSSQVPFIEAASDRDAAVALGAVHGHLRLSQIELMRRLSQVRLAEVLGPAAVEFDHALRLLDVGRDAGCDPRVAMLAGVSPAGYEIQRDEAALALTDRMLLDFLGRTVGTAAAGDG